MTTNTFFTEDFLLSNEFARRLYHDYASKQPIIDYHCHLPPRDIAEDTRFENLTAIWLAGDHYKWRAMRALGVPETYITGGASPIEKFRKWAYTVPYTVRNPLFHWTLLELKRYFDVDELLTEKTADAIYQSCTDKLQTPPYHTRNLLKRMQVRVVCTTDDPTDTLEYHRKIAASDFSIRVIPAFRPDKAYAVEKPAAFNQYISRLSEVSGVTISDHDSLLEALEKRVDFFHSHGCRLSDHGLEHLYYFEKAPADISVIFGKLKNNEYLSVDEARYFRFVTLLGLCRMYHARGWAQQFHLGALRNNNTRMLDTLGPDTGFDSIGDFSQARNLSSFLNELDRTDQLPRTILYNLNPADNEVFAAMIGNFNDGKTRGKMQYGSAWWFLDQKDGMEKQINALSNIGLLSCFVGMITDSRSFLSYPRHEYFRRILCNLIGKDVENGELPPDEKWLGKLVADVCYYNAREYFQFENA